MSLSKLLLLVPMGYALHTRMNSARGLLANAATAWLPGALVLHLLRRGLTPEGAVGSAGRYAAGYLAFVCVYELGYFANDTLGTRFDETPRRRLRHRTGPAFAAAFVAVRLAAWAGAAWAFGWHANPAWAGLYAALAVLLVTHNVIASTAYKAASFLQMSLLRFVAPVVPFAAAEQVPLLLVLGLTFFSYHRLMTYLVSKERLHLPERAEPMYYPKAVLATLPLTGLVAAAAWPPALLVHGYYLLAYLGLSRLRSRNLDAPKADGVRPAAAGAEA